MRKRYLTIWGLWTITLLLTPNLGYAATFSGILDPDYVPIQERAQGQSLTGAPLLNDSLYSNPAAGVFTQIYSLETSVNFPQDFSASILDTRTSDFGGGVAYFRKNLPAQALEQGNQEKVVQGLRLLLAGKMGEQYGAGVTGKMIWAPDIEGNPTRLYDVDLGSIGNFGWIQTGITLRNAFGGSSKLGFSREWQVGARIGYQDTLYLSIATRSLFDQFKPYQIGFGAEYVSPYHFSLKGGYRYLFNRSFSAWSGGLSILSSRLSVHYAVEFPTPEEVKIEHQVSLTLFM